MTTLRRHVSITCTVAVTWALAGAIAAAAQTPPSTPDAADRHPDEVAFRIDAQPIEGALKEFASQANLQLVYETAEVSPNIRSSHVAGAFTPEAALLRLLAHTNLDYKFINDRTVSIRSAEGALGSRAHLAIESVPRGAQPQSARSESPELPGDSSEQPAAADVTAEHDVRNGARRKDMEEVVVTAQKREERLQDVPVPVTAISAATLVDSNQLRLQDYYSSVPGLSVAPGIQSHQVLSIRGVSTGDGTNPTVGITVDDVPYGSSTNLGGGLVVPDMDPGDLARVEVLRGPQGTLYGASSMGGLLKFVTIDPSTDAITGSVQAGASSVHNGAEPGYNFRGSVNLPLSDTWAIRASGFTRQEPGYVNNPILHIDGVNEAHVSGGRISALWRPSDAVSLKLSALYQDTKGDGSNVVEVPTAGFAQTAGLGDLQQNDLLGTGRFTRKAQAYSATLTAKIGGADLTAVSGYNINEFSDSFDYSYALAGLAQFIFGVPGAPFFAQNKTDKFTQEIRLSVPIAPKVEWLFGAFYTHEKSRYDDTYVAADPATGGAVGQGLETSFPTTYEEYAAFTDVTLHFTDRFDIQFGGRESEIRQTVSETNSGPYVPVFFLLSSPVVYPEVDSKNNAFTYLVTPRFKVSSDFTIYGRAASGYRAGGPNAAPGEPRQYNPDKTQNYEIGVKGDFLDHTISVDVSVYHIKWKDIQITLIDPRSGFSYNTNGGRAKSQGVEFSVESKPLTGLTLGAWVVFNDAKLTETFPASSSAYGASGDRLPYSSRFSGNFSVERSFLLTSRITGFIGGSVSYMGDRLGQFTSPPPAVPPRQSFPAYAKSDVRAGLRYDSWTANFSVNNVADKRGVLRGGLGDFPPFGFSYIQPRTVGLSIAKRF